MNTRAKMFKMQIRNQQFCLGTGSSKTKTYSSFFQLVYFIITIPSGSILIYLLVDLWVNNKVEILQWKIARQRYTFLCAIIGLVLQDTYSTVRRWVLKTVSTTSEKPQVFFILEIISFGIRSNT